jgi:hypothetical protein
MLEEEAKRVVFDIHVYGQTVLKKMPEQQKVSKSKFGVTFENAITAANKYEVSRMFLHGARFSTEIYTRGCHWIPRMIA